MRVAEQGEAKGVVENGGRGGGGAGSACTRLEAGEGGGDAHLAV